MDNRRLPSGSMPRPVTLNSRGGARPPLPPPMFRFQPVRKEELAQMDAEARFSPRVNSQIRSPHPSQSPRPLPVAPPRRVQHIQHHNIPSTSYASETVEFNVPEEVYQSPRNNFVKTQPHHPAGFSPTVQHAQRTDIPSTSSARTSSEEPSIADLDDQEYEEFQKNSSGVVIKIPQNCKIFEYSLVKDGVKQILLIPMPSIATVNDVMVALPGILGIAPSEIDCSMIKPHEVVEDSEDGISFPMASNCIVDESAKAPPEAHNVGSTMNNWNQQVVQEEEESDEEYQDYGDEKPRAPILVNPKQFRGIMRRREMRQRLEDDGRIPRVRSKYLHESRHLHALNRKRNTDGKFEGDAEEEVDDEEVEDEAETDETAVTSTVPTIQYIASNQFSHQRFAPIAAAPHSQEMSYIQPNQQPPSSTQARYTHPPQQATSSTQPSTSYGSRHYGQHQH